MESMETVQNAECCANNVDLVDPIESKGTVSEISKELSNAEGEICMCGNIDCETCKNDFQPIYDNRELDKDEPTDSKILRKCKYCGEEFELLFAYRKHHLKCWRTFRQNEGKAATNRSKNKTFTKRKFPLNNNPVHVKRSCNVCGLTFKSKLKYSHHIREKKCSRPPPFICEKCGRVFKRLHLLISHENRKVPCIPVTENTSEVLNNVSLVTELEEQNVVKKASNILKCNKCGMQFTSPHWYEKHISQPNSCRVRAKKLKIVPQRLKMTHIEKFKTALGYKCKKCGEVFRYRSRFRHHMTRKIPCMPRCAKKTMPPIKCSVSDSANTEDETTNEENEELLRKPVSIESANTKVGRKIFRKYCKIANTQSKQNKEVDMMNKYGTLICCICDKKFFNSYTWNNHLRIHSTMGEKCPVKCPVCQAIFLSAYLLYCHQKTTNHWGKLMKSRINNCQCPFCGRKFAYVGSRKKHLQVHMKDHPVEVKEFIDSTTCALCNIHFVTETKKISHTKKVHLYEEQHDKKQGVNKIVEDTIKVEDNETPIKVKLKTKQEMPSTQSKKNPNNSVITKNEKREKDKTLKQAYPCSFCSKVFSRVINLVRHQQEIHDSCLMFQCSACNQKYSEKSMIAQHVKKQHKNIPKSNLIIKINKSNQTNNLLDTTIDFNEKQNLQSITPVQDFYDNSGRGIYSCEICNLTQFRKMSALQRHKKSKQHKDNIMKSKLENKLNETVTSNDIPSTSEVIILICSNCKLSFNSVSSFVPHRLNHFDFQNMNPSEINENNPYCCEICTENINHNEEIQSHLLGHLQTDKTFNSQSDNTELNKISDSQISFQEDKQTLNLDVGNDTINAINDKLETKEEPNKPQKEKKKGNFICKICKLHFRTKRLCNAHIRYCCRRKFICEHCKMQFTSKKRFQIHLSLSNCNSAPINLHCQYCSLDFSSLNDLGWHEKSCQKVHGSETGNFNLDNMNNLFHCKYCQSPFLTLQTCEDHENMYCKKNIYCSICKSYFASHKLLNKHKNKFHVESTLNCLVCGYNFPNIDLLNEHMKTHDSQPEIQNYHNLNNKLIKPKKKKLFPCSQCTRTYQDKYSLKQHLVTHNPFTCPVCGKVESSVCGFRKHPCRLPNGTFATGIMYRKKWKRTRISRMRQKSQATNKTKHIKKHRFSTVEDETPKLSEIEVKHINNTNQENDIENDTFSNNDNELKEKLPLDILRDNFSQLLYLFVADPELMSQLGWGQRLIDDVLDDVLQSMGQNTINKNPTISEIDRLRENIRVLFKVCIKDQIMNAVDGDNKPVDEIVVEILSMCKASLESNTTILDVS